MLSLSGCSFRPHTQTQIAYSRGHHEKDHGHVDLLCARVRGGGKAATAGEFRLGADICYGKLPGSSSENTYSLDVPIVGKQEAAISGITSTKLVRVTIPFLEYSYAALEANIPGEIPKIIGIRSPSEKDLALRMWAAAGYNIDIAVSETDYVTGGGTLDNIPGINIKGKFYGEFTNEVTLFGRIPLSISLRVDQKGKVTPTYGAGYKIQW